MPTKTPAAITPDDSFTLTEGSSSSLGLEGEPLGLGILHKVDRAAEERRIRDAIARESRFREFCLRKYVGRHPVNGYVVLLTSCTVERAWLDAMAAELRTLATVSPGVVMDVVDDSLINDKLISVWVAAQRAARKNHLAGKYDGVIIIDQYVTDAVAIKLADLLGKYTEILPANVVLRIHKLDSKTDEPELYQTIVGKGSLLGLDSDEIRERILTVKSVYTKRSRAEISSKEARDKVWDALYLDPKRLSLRDHVLNLVEGAMLLIQDDLPADKTKRERVMTQRHCALWRMAGSFSYSRNLAALNALFEAIKAIPEDAFSIETLSALLSSKEGLGAYHLAPLSSGRLAQFVKELREFVIASSAEMVDDSAAGAGIASAAVTASA